MQASHSLPRKERGIFESGPGIQRQMQEELVIGAPRKGCVVAIPSRSPQRTRDVPQLAAVSLLIHHPFRVHRYMITLDVITAMRYHRDRDQKFRGQGDREGLWSAVLSKAGA